MVQLFDFKGVLCCLYIIEDIPDLDKSLLSYQSNEKNGSGGNCT